MIRLPLKNYPHTARKPNPALIPGLYMNRFVSSHREHLKIRFQQECAPSYTGFPDESVLFIDDEAMSKKFSCPLILGYTDPVQCPLYLHYGPDSWVVRKDASQINYQNLGIPKIKANSKERRQKRQEKLRCNICKRDFSRKSSLIIHMRRHSGEKPYKCTHCPKAFAQSANLVAHKRTHTGEKPYACSVCGKCFSQSSSVTTHMRTHTGERPFQCAECGMAFAERSTLSKHFRVHSRKRDLKKAIAVQGFASRTAQQE